MTDNSDDLLHELFGEAVFEYPDSQAVEDGVLIPFLTPQGKDTGHRITNNAYTELKEHYRGKGYADYTEKQFHDFFFNEMLCLVPAAYMEWNQNRVLTTNYDFRVEAYDPDRSSQLWYVPNEVGGVTTMKPEDY